MQFGSLKQTANVAKALAKAGVLTTNLDQMSKYYCGTPFNSLAQEYLFTSNVFPLGIICQLFGSEGCCKSTLALGLLDQLFMQPGGQGVVIDTENKTSEAVFRSTISAESNQRFELDVVTTQEGAQAALNIRGKQVNSQTFGKDKGAGPVMLGMVLDSFRVASEATQDKVTADGHASKQFALEANLWRTFLATYNSMLLRSPMSLLIVNHMVEKDSGSPYGGKVKDVGGGMALKFYETYRILVTKVASTTNKTSVYTDLMLQTFKNSNGLAKRKIFPRVIYKDPDLPDGQFKIDWDLADIKLLTGPDIPREELKRNNVCNLKESSTAGLFTDEVLGLTKVPYAKIKEAIYTDPQRIAEFRRIMGIQTFKTTDQMWDEGWFYDARGGVAPKGVDEEEEE